MRIKIDCREFARLISAAQDRDLPMPDQARMRLHFAICQSCRNVEEQMAFLRRAMRAMGKDERTGW